MLTFESFGFTTTFAVPVTLDGFITRVTLKTIASFANIGRSVVSITLRSDA